MTATCISAISWKTPWAMCTVHCNVITILALEIYLGWRDGADVSTFSPYVLKCWAAGTKRRALRNRIQMFTPGHVQTVLSRLLFISRIFSVFYLKNTLGPELWTVICTIRADSEFSQMPSSIGHLNIWVTPLDWIQQLGGLTHWEWGWLGVKYIYIESSTPTLTTRCCWWLSRSWHRIRPLTALQPIRTPGCFLKSKKDPETAEFHMTECCQKTVPMSRIHQILQRTESSFGTEHFWGGHLVYCYHAQRWERLDVAEEHRLLIGLRPNPLQVKRCWWHPKAVWDWGHDTHPLCHTVFEFCRQTI